MASDTRHTHDLKKSIEIVRARNYITHNSDVCRTVRVMCKMPLSFMARMCSVTRMSVSNWERGALVPNGDTAVTYLEVLRQLCKTMDTSLEEVEAEVKVIRNIKGLSPVEAAMATYSGKRRK
jgi:DNA-binding XRE family transcriptional regulator